MIGEGRCVPCRHPSGGALIPISSRRVRNVRAARLCAPRLRHDQQQCSARKEVRRSCPRACAGLDKATMSEETPQPEGAAEGSSEPEVSALEKEMNALLATTHGVPRAAHAPTFAPPPHRQAEPSPARRRRRHRGTHPYRRGSVPTAAAPRCARRAGGGAVGEGRGGQDPPQVQGPRGEP
jgi:hypothetical protein